MTAIILSYFQIYCELISNQTVWRRQADIIIVILLMQYYLFSFIVLFHNHYIILLWEYAIIIILIAIITLLHYYITIYYSGLIHLWTTSGIALVRRPFIIPQRFKPPSTCSGFAPGKRLSNWQTNRRTDSGLDSLAHEVFQHRALPGALPAHHGDLRQVEAGVLADGWEGILQPVYHRDKLLHPPVPHGGQIEEAGDGESERETGGRKGCSSGSVSCLTPNPRSDDYAVQFIIDDWFICDDISINDNDVLQFWPSAPAPPLLLDTADRPSKHKHTSDMYLTK